MDVIPSLFAIGKNQEKVMAKYNNNMMEGDRGRNPPSLQEPPPSSLRKQIAA